MVTNRTNVWQYDRLYRLTNENISGLGILAYALDLVGNRTNRTSTGSVITQLPSAASSYNSNDWLKTDAYDTNGNTVWTTNGATTTGPYFYDPENRLTNFNNSVFLAYNGDGIRVSKTTGTGTTCYLTDDRKPSGFAQVLEEWTISGGFTNLTKVYAYGLALISQVVPSLSTNYFVSDGHGSTRLLLGPSGNINQNFTYDAFGTIIYSNGTPATPYLYCGEQFDPDIELYYLRARYLNSGTGRFWTRDTDEGDQEDPLSLHKYLYCRADTVDLVDPLGHRFRLSNGCQSEFDEAKRYLSSKSAWAKTIINELETNSTTYTIVIESLAEAKLRIPFDSDSQPEVDFQPDGNIIHWSAYRGLYWYDDEDRLRQRTPAMSLLHEFGHAYDKATDPTGFQQRSNHPTNDDWKDEEEKYNITFNENRVAREIHEPERQFHNFHQQHRKLTKGPTVIAAAATTLPFSGFAMVDAYQ